MANPGFYIAVIFICIQVDFSSCHFSAKEHVDEQQPVSGTAPPPISDHRFFLHEIFHKYGHDGQMTFEGFEHLLESLGLGNIIISDHDVGAHKESEFRNVHSTHDHSKKADLSDDVTGRAVTAAYQETSRSATATTSTSPSTSLHRHHSHDNALPSSHPDTSDIEHYHGEETRVHSNDTRVNESSATENIYHYRLREARIPELLVNISSLVDQHQEFQLRTPDIVIEQCLSPKEILDTFGINQTSSLNPVSFLHLCPAIIYELDQGHCLFRDRGHAKTRNIASFDQWLYSSIAVLIISLCGLLSVAVIPIMQKWFYHTLLQFLVGLAVGSLSGDGLLHLMPHAMLGSEGGHDHHDPVSSVSAEKTAVWRGLAALGGIFFFFVAERLLGSYAAYRKQRKESKAAKLSKGVDMVLSSELPHNGNVGAKLSQYRKSSYEYETSEKEMINMLSADKFSSRKPSVESLTALEANYNKHPSFSNGSTDIPKSTLDYLTKVAELNGHDNGRGHSHGHSHEVPNSVSAVAWMVIMGDGLHNFCDGLAIGAAFASGIEGGISTTVAVFCHELPHELGDFAMLLKTGMKVKQALLYNGLSSVLCFVGMIIGVSLGNVQSATSWVFAATAGMFLYIALVDMLPELSVPSDDPDVSPTYQLAVQVLGICFGVSIMLLIANYEQDLQNILS